MITARQVLAVFPKCRDSNLVASILGKVAPEFEVNTKPRFAMWFAQLGHESGSFNKVREDLSYSAPRLMQVWPKRFPTKELAAPFERQPEKLANFVYANRLGNGKYETGDGWRFRGGGWIQLTGRDNYRAAGTALELPLEVHPQKIEDKMTAARVAGHFWRSHGLNELCDVEIGWPEFQLICRKINGGDIGQKERYEAWVKTTEVMT